MARGVSIGDGELEGRVVAGVDTHSLCVLDDRGRVALRAEFPADAAGYAALADAIGGPGRCAAVGMEGTCSYGRGLADELERRGYRVVEVLNKRKERRRRRGEGKDDAADAERAARDVLAGDGTSVPKARGGWADELRALLTARERCEGARVQAHAAALALARTAPEAERRRWEGMGQRRMMRAMLAIPEEGAGALGRSMLALARVWDACDREASDLEGRMRAVLEERCPAILAVDGCGPVRGAELAVAAGENPGRIGGEAKFAMLCGAAPIPASSGKTSGRMRLNRGGDRRANRALHTIVVNRMRNDPRTRAYAARRMSGPRPLTKKEVIRCLKRYVAREVFRALTHPCDLPEAVDVGALREARRAAGMSQGEVGRALGVSASSICAVERRRDGTRRLAERYRDWVAEGMPLDGGISEKGACIS